ncbi:MAG: DUF3307 domain-containing protein [Bacillota bacterium]|nr:DUF3307 domain-containing protein [Bacillota bacterium]
MTFLLLGLLAHVVADFVLQADSVVESKCKRMIGGYLRHGAIVFASSAVAFHLYGLGVAAVLALIVSATHVAIDWLKNLAERGGAAGVNASAGASASARARVGAGASASARVGASASAGVSVSSRSSRSSPRRSLLVFLVDQCAHAAVLVAVWELADTHVGRLSDKVLWVYKSVLLQKTVPTLLPACAELGISLNRVLVLTLAYVVVIFAGAVLVRLMLDAFSIGVEPRLATNAGRYIGMVERALMLTLVLVDALPSIAFVLTAKSLARFQELNDMRFAEYYLVGTLTSACIALGVGIVAGAVLPAL